MKVRAGGEEMISTNVYRSSADCAEELDAAVATAEALRARLAEGDRQISPSDLLEAEATERLAEMRLTAARSHEEREATARAAEVAEAARTTLISLETEEAAHVAADFKIATDALCAAFERVQAFNARLASALAEVNPDERRSHAHLTPLSDVLDALREQLGGPTHPSYLLIDDARHAARGHRS
jgi:hypothetical protein